MAKVFQVLTILASLVGLSIHLYFTVSSYLEYKFTESSFERRGTVRFPDVSLCNVRGLSSSNFKAAAKVSPRIETILHHLNNSDSFSHRMPLRDYVAFADQDAILMGHNKEDMILSFVFNKLPCK